MDDQEPRYDMREKFPTPPIPEDTPATRPYVAWGGWDEFDHNCMEDSDYWSIQTDE